MHHSFFIRSSVDGHLGCFCVLAIVNSAVVNTKVYVSLRIMVFSRYMPRTWIAGSYSKSILVLYRAPYCSPEWLYQFTYLPMLQEGLLLVDILMMAIMTGVRWSSSVQFSHSVMSNSLWPHGLQHTRLPQTHVHQVSEANQPSYPLLSSTSPAFNISQHQGLFQ